MTMKSLDGWVWEWVAGWKAGLQEGRYYINGFFTVETRLRLDFRVCSSSVLLPWSGLNCKEWLFDF